MTVIQLSTRSLSVPFSFLTLIGYQNGTTALQLDMTSGIVKYQLLSGLSSIFPVLDQKITLLFGVNGEKLIPRTENLSPILPYEGAIKYM